MRLWPVPSTTPLPVAPTEHLIDTRYKPASLDRERPWILRPCASAQATPAPPVAALPAHLGVALVCPLNVSRQPRRSPSRTCSTAVKHVAACTRALHVDDRRCATRALDMLGRATPVQFRRCPIRRSPMPWRPLPENPRAVWMSYK